LKLQTTHNIRIFKYKEEEIQLTLYTI